MLLSHIPSKLSLSPFPNLISLSISYPFFRHSKPTQSQSSSSPSKKSYNSKTSSFEQLQSQYTKDYFQNYRKQVQQSTIINSFRRQIFQKNNTQLSTLRQYDNNLNKQQQQINTLLQKGTKNNINKYSRKILQHIINKRDMFKGKQNNNVFKDYVDYSAYKTNYVSIEDRNYGDMDMLNRSNTESRIYEFIDNLPDSYAEKQQVRREIEHFMPFQDGLTISQYGKYLQNIHTNISRYQQIKHQISQQNSFKISLPKQYSQQISSKYKTKQQLLQHKIQQGYKMITLSVQVMNKIYDLYIQGWSVKDISYRFGIVPRRTKFHIWARARYYNQVLPKLGFKYYINSIMKQKQFMQNHDIMDYGLDLDSMINTQKYHEITGWQSKRVDAQRTPQQYTQALQKLQKRDRVVQSQMLQVGTDGLENKKYLLKEWKIYKGKRSDQYYLKNKNRVLNKVMFENRKIKSVYY